ncbi:hypothetical protein FNV43_RR07665 [Rhamnella rubrinervis]|uniref:Uncharacterized protein n=1 Tax=Rhamnella rubrinervis TaxID=2594499 RepID=A0A8K0HFT9_9ROSA|nr:hypothetical protein FNV43_RR07665 [Rhamnella rubrinervis]
MFYLTVSSFKTIRSHSKLIVWFGKMSIADQDPDSDNVSLCANSVVLQPLHSLYAGPIRGLKENKLRFRARLQLRHGKWDCLEEVN